MKLKDRVAIVTGSTRGMGRAIAEEFARNGAKVIINYVNSDDIATNIVSELTNEGLEVDKFKADVSKEEDIKALIDFTLKRFGGIDIVVNNAGIVSDKEWNEKTADDWNRLLNTNLIGSFLLSRYAAEYLKKSKSGRVINITSTNANNTYSPYSMDYDATKAGLITLTKNLAVALAPNVLVNAISPGWIDTDMNKELPEEYIEAEKQKIFVKRLGQPEEIAKVALFLASDDASFVNGSIIDVDGGYQ